LTSSSPFFTRAQTPGILGRQLARLVWWIFKTISKPFGQAQGSIFSFCGPAILVSLVGVWALTLAIGAALIIHPKLGTSVRANSGETKKDFMTAMFAGGSSISIVGASTLGLNLHLASSETADAASTLMSFATKGTKARKRDSCLCSRQKLGAPLADDETDDSAADRAQDKDRCIGFSDYGIGHT